MPLSGLLVCGRCGERMIDRGHYKLKDSGIIRRYYHCIGETTKLPDGSRECLGVGAIYDDEFLPRLMIQLLVELSQADTAKKIAAANKSRHQHRRTVKIINKEIAAHRRAGDMIWRMIDSGTLKTDPGEAAGKLEDHKQAKLRLEAERDNLKQAKLDVSVRAIQKEMDRYRSTLERILMDSDLLNAYRSGLAARSTEFGRALADGDVEAQAKSLARFDKAFQAAAPISDEARAEEWAAGTITDGLSNAERRLEQMSDPEKHVPQWEAAEDVLRSLCQTAGPELKRHVRRITVSTEGEAVVELRWGGSFGFQ